MKTEKNYFWLSLTLHLLLGASFLSMHFSKQGNSMLGLPQIAGYIYQLPSRASVKQLAETHAQAELQKQAKSVLAIKKQSTSAASVQQQKAEAEITATGSQQEAALLKILHEAIFEKQTYPPSALLLHQSGTVTISLSVSPTGDILQEVVLKSSHYRSLDEAALQAVSAISPVTAARPYLNHTESFSIDVVFE